MPRFLDIDYLTEVQNRKRSVLSRCLMTTLTKLQCNETYAHDGTLEDYTYWTPWKRATVMINDETELPLVDQIKSLDVNKTDTLVETITVPLSEQDGTKRWDPEVVPSSNPESPAMSCDDLLHIKERLGHAESEDTLSIRDNRDKYKYVEAPLVSTFKNSIPGIEQLLAHLTATVVQDPFIQDDGKDITEQQIFRNDRLYSNKHTDDLQSSSLHYEQFQMHQQHNEDEFLEETFVINEVVSNMLDDIIDDLSREDVAGVLDDDISKLEESRPALSEPYDSSQQPTTKKSPEEAFIMINESGKRHQERCLHEDALMESPSKTDIIQLTSLPQDLMEALEKEIMPPFMFPVLISAESIDKLNQAMWTREKFFKDISSLIIKVPVTQALVLKNLIEEARILLNAGAERCSGELELNLTWDPVASTILNDHRSITAPESLDSVPGTEIKSPPVVEEFFPFEYTEDAFANKDPLSSEEEMQGNLNNTNGSSSNNLDVNLSTSKDPVVEDTLIEEGMEQLKKSSVHKSDDVGNHSMIKLIEKKDDKQTEQITENKMLNMQKDPNEQEHMDKEQSEKQHPPTNKGWNKPGNNCLDLENERNKENQAICMEINLDKRGKQEMNMDKGNTEQEVMEIGQNNNRLAVEKQLNTNNLDMKKQRNEKETDARAKTERQIKRRKIMPEETMKKYAAITWDPVDDFFMLRVGKTSSNLHENVTKVGDTEMKSGSLGITVENTGIKEERQHSNRRQQENTGKSTLNEKPAPPTKSNNTNELTPTKEKQRKKMKTKIIEITLPESYQEIMNLLERVAKPVLTSLKDAGHLDQKATFNTLKPCDTRFMLKQQPLLQQNNRREYKLTALLHALVSSADLMCRCDLATACLHLRAIEDKYRSNIGDELQHVINGMLDTLHSLAKKQVDSPKITELHAQLESWYTRKITKEGSDQQPKILIIVAFDVPSLVNSICRAIGQLTYFVCKDIKEAGIGYSNISSQLDHCNCLVLTESQIGEDFPWAHFSLVVEHEHHPESPWEQMCLRQNIRYIALKVVWPSRIVDVAQHLETSKLDEIKQPANTKEMVHTVIGSSAVTSNNDLLHLLEARFNIQVLERDYISQSSTCQPFPDIAIDETTAVILLPAKQLAELNAAEPVINRIAGLSLQCCLCTVLVCNDDASTSYTYSGQTVNNLARLHAVTAQYSRATMDYEVKVLYCYSREQTAQIVRSIADASLEDNPVWSSEKQLKKTWLSETMSKQEKFLLSLPCFNSVSAQRVLSSHSIRGICLMPLPDLFKTFPWLPDKVLKELYSIVHHNEDRKPELPFSKTIPLDDRVEGGRAISGEALHTYGQHLSVTTEPQERLGRSLSGTQFHENYGMMNPRQYSSFKDSKSRNRLDDKYGTGSYEQLAQFEELTSRNQFHDKHATMSSQKLPQYEHSTLRHHFHNEHAMVVASSPNLPQYEPSMSRNKFHDQYGIVDSLQAFEHSATKSQIRERYDTLCSKPTADTMDSVKSYSKADIYDDMFTAFTFPQGHISKEWHDPLSVRHRIQTENNQWNISCQLNQAFNRQKVNEYLMSGACKASYTVDNPPRVTEHENYPGYDRAIHLMNQTPLDQVGTNEQQEFIKGGQYDNRFNNKHYDGFDSALFKRVTDYSDQEQMLHHRPYERDAVWQQETSSSWRQPCQRLELHHVKSSCDQFDVDFEQSLGTGFNCLG